MIYMKIDCYQIFCIYQQNRKCLLDTIDIGEAGLCCCQCNISAPVDENELNRRKAQLRNLYLHMDEGWKRE